MPGAQYCTQIVPWVVEERDYEMPENHNPDVIRISRFGTAAWEVGMSREGLI